MVKLMGGIGNRLFQVAAARGLASTYVRDWGCMDTGEESNHDQSPHHKLCVLLRSGGISVAASWAEVAEAEGCGDAGASICINEPDNMHCRVMDMPPELLTEPRSFVTLTGYLQAEAYWRFTAGPFMRYLLDGLLEGVAEDPGLTEWQAAGGRVWAVHVRRGDYVGLEEVFVQLWPDYFEHCFSDVQKRYRTPQKFLVVSDDQAWSRENVLPLIRACGGEAKMVSPAPAGTSPVLHDLRVLNSCEAGIICSNSTFSWWGAWGGSNPNRPAYFPRKWFTRLPHAYELLHNSGVGHVRLR